MITPATIKAQFPEFNSIDDDTIQTYINQAQFFVSLPLWCGSVNGIAWIDVGQSYFVASNLLTQVVNVNDTTQAAPYTQKTAGQASVSLGVSEIDAGNPDALMMSNKYGQQYLMFRNALGGVISSSACATTLSCGTC